MECNTLYMLSTLIKMEEMLSVLLYYSRGKSVEPDLLGIQRYIEYARSCVHDELEKEKLKP